MRAYHLAQYDPRLGAISSPRQRVVALAGGSSLSNGHRMDVTQALADAENTLRDFIGLTLNKQLGADWINKCGVTPERIIIWKGRKDTESKRQQSGVVEERLLYYADFYDISTILKKNWSGDLSEALGEWKTMEIFLKELEKLRDPDAHRRQLMPHQKSLAIGISGEIRSRIVRFRSKRETSEDCFSRLESVRDNLGNIWTYGDNNFGLNTQMLLRPRDSVDLEAIRERIFALK